MLLGVGQLPRPDAPARRIRRLEDSLPLDELLVELRKPEVKAAILAEADLPADPHRQFEALTERRPYLFGRIFPLGDPPDYEPTPDRSIAGIAAATGARPVGGALRPRRRRRAAARRVHQLRRRARRTTWPR